MVHALDSTLRGADEVLVCHNLVDQLLLRKLVKDSFGVGLLVLPLFEINSERMVQAVEDEPGVLFDSLARLDDERLRHLLAVAALGAAALLDLVHERRKLVDGGRVLNFACQLGELLLWGLECLPISTCRR